MEILWDPATAQDTSHWSPDGCSLELTMATLSCEPDPPLVGPKLVLW